MRSFVYPDKFAQIGPHKCNYPLQKRVLNADAGLGNRLTIPTRLNHPVLALTACVTLAMKRIRGVSGRRCWRVFAIWLGTQHWLYLNRGISQQVPSDSALRVR